MDLSRFSLLDYFAADLAIPSWWDGVALPFFAGVLYLVAAFVCLRVLPGRSVTLSVITGCILVAAALSFFNPGLGLYAAISLTALLICVLLRAS